MAEPDATRKAWLIAVWPGMGQVAAGAGYYLLAKLGMSQVAEFSAEALFDIEAVEVKDGLILPPRRPRSRIFRCEDEKCQRDLLLFVGEAQPPLGKHAFCRRLVEFAKEHNVERIVTFAAMATQMHPHADSKVFGAATSGEQLRELERLQVEVLKDGQIGGLNGVLIGAAAELQMQGTCLLGEMPHIFSQFAFPKATRSVLEVFCTMFGIELDFTELQQHAELVDEQLGQILARIEEVIEQQQQSSEEEESFAPEAEEERLSPEENRRIEALFDKARQDRSTAYELKRELDRLNLFDEYEDRFLDLFRKEG